MQALWSRTARNPGTCKCIQCISNTAAVSRRAGVMGVRRPSLVGTPTSTFVYTAIFTVGLAIDAKAKHRRNEQWDTAFALLREEIEKPNLRSRQILKDVDKISRAQKRTQEQDAQDVFVEGESINVIDGFADSLSGTVDWDAVHQLAGTELAEDRVFNARQVQTAVDIQQISNQMWKLLAYDSRFPGAETLEWPTNTGERLIQYHLPPQSLWSIDEMRRKALSQRQTWKKQVLQELSVGTLIHGLLNPAFAMSGLPEYADMRSLSPAIQNIISLDPEENERRRIEMMKNIAAIEHKSVNISFEDIARAKRFTRYPGIPQYFQDDDGDYYHICKQMNKAIKQILFGDGDALVDANQAPLTVAKVCHNLLVSSSAPDVQTFNILIAGLTRWKLPEMVDMVIAAFRRCKIRPNEITCVAILDHYLQCDRPDDFSKFVAKMRGVYRGGLMLANPTISINERGAKRLIRVSKDKIIQKVHPTPLVFNTLMLGALKFAGCARTLDIYYEMKEDGWGLDITGLSYFLDDCIREADWNNGVYIWNEILSIIGKAKPERMASAYSKMLSLCSVTGNTAAFNQLLKEVVNRGLDRRFVVKSALKTAQELQTRSSHVAPPMTADNLLVAIGEYMDDSTKDNVVGVEEPPASFQQNYDSRHDSKPASTDPDEAWSSWVNQELGDTADQGYIPLAKTELEEPPAKDPDAAWSSWLEHELGQKIEIGSTANPTETKDSNVGIKTKQNKKKHRDSKRKP